MSEDGKIRVIENGPLRVSGDVDLGRVGIERNEHDRPTRWTSARAVEHGETYGLCRCGHSSNKPFCDGTHKSIEWQPAETADRGTAADRRKAYRGEDLVLTDDKQLCVHAGFCVREDTKAWDAVYKAREPEARALLEDMVHHCPSGRLELHASDDPTPIEQPLAARIDAMDDGPLYVQGGIEIEGADGASYEVRNRVTLCRCGASANKPFCDGAHAAADFRDA